MPPRTISLRGVEVHNLRRIDLDLPHRQLIVFCGLSGSGKSSLAFDTLYAEGQRRYLETFSAYTRQFLDRLEKPDADRIDGLPPAIAVGARAVSRSSRSTVGTATEINDYLRLLWAKVGTTVCQGCGRPVRRDDPASVAESLAALPSGTRFLVTAPVDRAADEPWSAVAAALVEEGFVRVLVGGRTVHLGQDDLGVVAETEAEAGPLELVIDRLAAGSVAPQRLRDSLETAFHRGRGRAAVVAFAESLELGVPRTVDGAAARWLRYSHRLACEDCGLEYPEPEPRLFSFNSPLGACPTCEGFGNVIDLDMDLVVPDPSKSLREGAIAPWNSPAYEHEKLELLALAGDYRIPVDVPFAELDDRARRLIMEGVPERNFGGLRGFFAWLERKKYKMHVRVFLSRWRSYRECPACGGSRLKPEALATQVGGLNLDQVCRLQVAACREFFGSLELADWQRPLARRMLEAVTARLDFLDAVGLGYLSLDRTLRTLSGGEAQRVALTSALGSSLVNMLYVLDEPSIGLHPRDTDRLIRAVVGLRDRGNTVIVVEHEEAMLRAADQIVEIGPGAGYRGGQVVFQGTPEELIEAPTLTGDYLAGRRMIPVPARRREPNHGWLKLCGARGNNLQDVTVEFPLGVLCVVTGVSGSGKSTLVEETLYPALCRRLKKEGPKPAPYRDLFGDGQLEDVILVDQSPIGRSPRSNPVTYLKVFDEIRNVFADTVDAKTRNFTASHFSFNVEGGRCERCQGDGYLEVDMQFLADVLMKCPECDGRRYRADVLEITYRGSSIANVLEMTVREAFLFFRGQPKVQARLKKLIDVGLDYVRLGQPASTLSGGESQRLKLAGYVASARRSRCLLLLDEPSTGLHFADVTQLLDCFEALLAGGHSLVVVEHHLGIIRAADYVIDLGPGAAQQGGQVVATGTPEEVARSAESVTGRYLAESLRLAAASVGAADR